MLEIARDVALIPGIIANAYLVGNRQSWVLVDTATPGNQRKIRRAAEARFGAGAKPAAILLTHGHFDHAGSAPQLAAGWQVPVFAHGLELPYLTGRAHYPPLDTSKPGFFSKLARLFPSGTVDLGGRVQELAVEIEGWQTIDTPGHTPGHISFYRPSDGVLLAGDALTTMDLDSFWGTLAKRPKVCRPPVPATIDWLQARDSVRLLAALRPTWIAAGHGRPMRGAAEDLERLADDFVIP